MFFLNLYLAISQTVGLKVQALDASSQKPLPFIPIQVLPVPLNGITDMDGTYVFSLKPGEYTVVAAGNAFYAREEKKIRAEDQKNIFVQFHLLPTIGQLQEITIVPEKNPADEIIRMCIRRMPQFDPRRLDTFCLQKNAIMKIMISDKEGNEEFYLRSDSSQEKKYKKYIQFIKNKYLYFFQSQSEVMYTRQTGMKEKIVYAHAPGFEKSPFSLFFATLQSFGFYDEEIHLMDETYLSPLSWKGMKHYRYRLTDTLSEGTDTFYVISISPRKHSVFSLLKGTVYVHKTDYYMKGVDMKPSAFSGKYLYSTRQFYTKNPEGIIYPHQTDTYILLPNESLQDKGINGEPLYFKLRAEIRMNHFQTDTFLSLRKSDPPFEESVRMASRPLFVVHDMDSLRVRNTEKFSDSVMLRWNIQKKLIFFSNFVMGYIPLGKIGLEWPWLLRYNLYEGYAPGIGLGSLVVKNRQFVWSAMGRYGVGDKDWKARLMAGYQWPDGRKNTYLLQLGWMKEIRESGSLDVITEPFLLNDEGIRGFYLSNADAMKSHFLLFRIQWVRSLSVRFMVLGNEGISRVAWKDNEGIYRYEYSHYLMDAFLRWKQGEFRLKSALGTLRYQEKKNGMEVQVWYKKSFVHPFSKRIYIPVHRVDVAVSDDFFPDGMYGMRLSMRAGYSFESASYNWLYHHHASRYMGFSVSFPQGMESMFINEFMSEKYLQGNFSFVIRRIFPVNRVFNPEMELVHNACIGEVRSRERYQQVVMSVPEKIYTEAGIRLLKLYGSTFSQLGVGVFYRYGNYAHEISRFNWVFKLAASYQF